MRYSTATKKTLKRLKKQTRRMRVPKGVKWTTMEEYYEIRRLSNGGVLMRNMKIKGGRI